MLLQADKASDGVLIVKIPIVGANKVLFDAQITTNGTGTTGEWRKNPRFFTKNSDLTYLFLFANIK